jgi:hypothetical protein
MAYDTPPMHPPQTTNLLPAAAPLIARLPIGEKVQSTHTCTLNLRITCPQLKQPTSFPAWCHNPSSQLSLCATPYARLPSPNSTAPSYSYRGHTIMCGHKCTRTGLWMMPLTNIANNKATDPVPTTKPISTFAANVDATSSATKYACYIHQCLCSPPSVTFLMALNCSEELPTIPGLTLSLIKQHLPRLIATNK